MNYLKSFSCFEDMSNYEIVSMLIYRDKFLHDLGLSGYPLEGWYDCFIEYFCGGNKNETFD